ncbi:MAG: AsmA-like C-terminal domain-containing protein [Desulfuromonadaceae bacterium]|nr:AsmA-like C-terminal domain-containing protein [Desulfuromonadaceae bacterium]MDD5107064.1 AsmA-like C-terminal domain-containing protein [Desulfuromonadaceae bacterium]
MKVPVRFIKISGLLLATVVALITATALFLPYLLDVNAYRTEIVAALQQSLHRSVRFSSGSFAWHFGPSFQFKSFNVKDRDGTTDFISSRTITVQVALIPLLGKKVDLRKLVLDEATISLVRAADGTLNIDDLLQPGSDDSVRVNFKHIRVNNGTIHWSDMVDRKNPLSATLRDISLTLDNVARGKNGHAKLSGEILAKSGTPAHIALSGGIHLPPDGESLLNSKIDCTIALKQVEIGRFWTYFERFVPFANSGGRLDFTCSFKGKPQDFSAKGKIIIKDATVRWPTVFHTPLSPKTVQLEYSGSLNRKLIDISTVDVSMEGFRIKGSFQLQDYLTKDPRIVAKAYTPSTFRYEDVRDYVPYGIIESGASDYIENKIKTGIFKLDTGILEGRISEITHMEIGQNCNTLMIRGPVEKAVLSYGPTAPTFNNLKGIIELKGKNFNLVDMTGNFGTSPFSLNGSITEYNTDKTSDYPIKMDISPRPPEISWLANIAGLTKLEYANSSSLQLTGGGHYSAYRLNGDWDLKQASYTLPGYINKPVSMPHTLVFSTVIGKDFTRVTSVNYALQPLVITGTGLIGYGKNPYLGFDLQTNKFVMDNSLPILSMWKKYNIQGSAQAHIKAGGDPVDMSAMDYYGTVYLTRVSFQPDENLNRISGVSGMLVFNGNNMESSSIATRYGASIVTMKATIKSLKNPEGDITIASPQLYLRDLNLAEKYPDASIMRMNARFTIHKDSIALHNASGLINSSNFSLDGIYHTGSVRQATITATSTKLDIDDLRMLLTQKEQDLGQQKSQRPEIQLTLNVDAGNFGKVTFRKLNAAVLDENGTIYLQNLTAGLFGGKLTAKGRIASGGEQGDRYDLTVDITRTDAEKLFAALDITREVTGTLTIGGNLTARGNSFVDIKKTALGNIRLTMANGSLRKFNTLSKVFSILNVSQLLKFKLPDMVSGGMPYSSIKGSFAVKDGTLTTKDLFISSNAINMSVIGSANIVKEELDFTIGAQPLQTVDKIVNRIPIVGWLLTGKEKDLLTAYFEAKGKWDDPRVEAIQIKSMSKGMLNMFVRIFQLPVKLFTDTGEVILGK